MTAQVILKATPVMRALAVCACGGAERYQVVDDVIDGGTQSASTNCSRGYSPGVGGASGSCSSGSGGSGSGGSSGGIGSGSSSGGIGSGSSSSGSSISSSSSSSTTAATAAAVGLFETMLHTPTDGFFLRELHLRRMLSSAAALGFATRPEAELQAELDAQSRRWPADEASRVRLLLHKDGRTQLSRVALGGRGYPPVLHPPLSLDAAVLTAAPLYTVRLDTEPVCSADASLRHKSTDRAVYEAARLRVGLHGPPDPSGVFDVMMYNEGGELTECSIANIALRESSTGEWLTPPADCGLLPGTMREAMLAAGWLHERVLTLEDLTEDASLLGFNALRGTFRLRLERRRAHL